MFKFGCKITTKFRHTQKKEAKNSNYVYFLPFCGIRDLKLDNSTAEILLSYPFRHICL